MNYFTKLAIIYFALFCKACVKSDVGNNLNADDMGRWLVGISDIDDLTFYLAERGINGQHVKKTFPETKVLIYLPQEMHINSDTINIRDPLRATNFHLFYHRDQGLVSRSDHYELIVDGDGVAYQVSSEVHEIISVGDNFEVTMGIDYNVQEYNNFIVKDFKGSVIAKARFALKDIPVDDNVEFSNIGYYPIKYFSIEFLGAN